MKSDTWWNDFTILCEAWNDKKKRHISTDLFCFPSHRVPLLLVRSLCKCRTVEWDRGRGERGIDLESKT